MDSVAVVAAVMAAVRVVSSACGPSLPAQIRRTNVRHPIPFHTAGVVDVPSVVVAINWCSKGGYL